jgi:hypothetical protein
VKLGERFKSMGFMPDIGKLTDMFNAKFDALIAKLDEILVELRKQNPGQVVLALVCAVLFLALIGLFALCTPGENDQGDGLGRIQLVSHGYDDGGGDNGCWDGECYDGGDSYGNGRYDYDYGSHDRRRNERRNRGAFSPGPFDDSPVTIIICPPGTQYCGSDGGRGRGDEPPPEERDMR